MDKNDKEAPWDVFISYASEDRADVAEPLAQALQSLGLRVWYDQSELKLGHSVRKAIDHGLRSCSRGIVILSPAFFSKHYPNRELDGLLQREIEGEPLVLPIWHGVTASDVRDYSPPLADRMAVSTADGLPTVVARILEVVRPDALEAMKRLAENLKPLPELRTGREVMGVISGGFFYNFANEDPRNENELDLVSGFLQNLQDWGDILGDLDVADRVRIEFSITEMINELGKAGWKALGKRVIGTLPGLKETCPGSLVFVARKQTAQVFEMSEGNFLVFPGAPEEGADGV